jgi:hypothetical protein
MSREQRWAASGVVVLLGVLALLLAFQALALVAYAALLWTPAPVAASHEHAA